MSCESIIDTPIATYSTDFPGDTVEWGTCEGYYDTLICGTYLSPDSETGETKRKGILYQYKLDEKQEQLDEVLRFECNNAILDVKWVVDPSSVSRPIIVTAESDSGVGIFGFNNDNVLASISSVVINDNLLSGQVLNTSLSVAYNFERVFVSATDGHVSVINLSTGLVEKRWLCHTSPYLKGTPAEVWVVHQDTHENNTLFSGGDDGIFKQWDTRTHTIPVSTNKYHEMGVCSIANHPTETNIICTGSYDECLHVWDKRHGTNPVTSYNAKGGIWRIKFNPHRSHEIALACVYSGFKILDISTPIKERYHYTPHDSLAYGIDYYKGALLNKKQNLLAACSFYDHKLSLWSY